MNKQPPDVVVHLINVKCAGVIAGGCFINLLNCK